MMGVPSSRMVVILMIQASAPPRPPCYPDDKAWRDWLVSAHLTGMRVARRHDTGKSQGNRQTHFRLLPTSEIPFCDGCTVGHQREMERQGRCHPCTAAIPAEV